MTLLEAVRLARRNLGLIVLCVLATVGLAAAYAAVTPRVYSATSSVFVTPSGAEGINESASTNIQLGVALATQYSVLVNQPEVRAAAEEKLGLKPGQLDAAISYVADEKSPTIAITAMAGSPQRAVDAASAITEATADKAAFFYSGAANSKSRSLKFEVIGAPQLNTTPVAPDVPRILLVGFGLGLLVAYAVVMGRTRLDTRLRSPQDVASVTEYPVIGNVPRSRDLGARLHSASLLSGAVGESLRHLRTNLLFADPDNPPRTLAVTSAQPSEGKSTVSALVARSLALRGQQVILIDADLRRPMVENLFGVEDSVGLTQVLSGTVSLNDALVETDTEGLLVLPAGRIPHNPSEVVGSARMEQLITELSRTHMVILDAPPILPVTDALILAQRVDGLLVIAMTGKSRSEALKRALDLADGVKARIFGIVLNGVPQGRGAGVYGYDTYGYGPGSETY